MSDTDQNQNNLVSSPENSPENSQEVVEQLTVSEAITGVFTEPRDTFTTIKFTPKKNYWIVPIIIIIVLNLIASVISSLDPELMKNVMDKQKQKTREQLDEQVKKGAMTKEQADQQYEQAAQFMNPEGSMFKIIAYVGSVVQPFILLFLMSLIYFIVLKILRTTTEFHNILNVVGLSMLISGIGLFISTIISIIMGDMQSVSLSLLFSEESVGSKIYSLITRFDLFSIWFYTVISIGLAKISLTSVSKTSVFVFGIWIIYSVVTSMAF